MMTVSQTSQRPAANGPIARPMRVRPEPFRDAEEAWFWTMAALVARREGSPRGVDGSGPPRPAMPEDVLRCLDRQYRNRRITVEHARVLRRWGERGIAPNILLGSERADARVWREALDRLEGSLRNRGIVGSEE